MHTPITVHTQNLSYSLRDGETDRTDGNETRKHEPSLQPHAAWEKSLSRTGRVEEDQDEWEWQLYGWARRRSECWEQAAAWLLVDAWQSEQDHHSVGRFSFVADAGLFSAVGLNALADEVWPPARDTDLHSA